MIQCGDMLEDAKQIITCSIQDMLPDRAVAQALHKVTLQGNIYVVSFGKAGWQMASAASAILGDRIKKGVIVTKYGHSKGKLSCFSIVEAGHPVPDDNSVRGADMTVSLLREAKKGDTVILLVSGGGSSLLEKPEEGLSLENIQEVTKSFSSAVPPFRRSTS